MQFLHLSLKLVSSTSKKIRSDTVHNCYGSSVKYITHYKSIFALQTLRNLKINAHLPQFDLRLSLCWPTMCIQYVSHSWSGMPRHREVRGILIKLSVLELLVFSLWTSALVLYLPSACAIIPLILLKLVLNLCKSSQWIKVICAQIVSPKW